METLAQVLPRLYHEFVHYAIKYYAQYPRPTTLYVGFRFVQPLAFGACDPCWRLGFPVGRENNYTLLKSHW